MEPIDDLEEKVNRIQELTYVINDLVNEVRLELYDELLEIGPASNVINVSERQLRRIAGDPDTVIKKYLRNGKEKMKANPKPTFYKFSELHKYNKNQR